jgi:hypothetical protein
MSRYLDLIFVGPEQALPILVAAVLWIGLVGLGALFTNKDRLIEVNAIYGWAVISGVFTVVGIIIKQPFFVMACSAALLSLINIYRTSKSRVSLFLPGVWRILVLALPLLWVAGAMEPSQWDEFSHWLPAPKYLLEFNGFPTKEQPYAGPYMLPAYPYGWPFLTYLSGLIAGQFVANVTSTLNVFLLLSFSTFALRTGLRISGKVVKSYISWPFATSAVLFATLFNPTFVQKIVLTAYSDVSTSVLTGFCLLIGYYFLESLAKRDQKSTWSGAWQLALALSLLINVRQTNLVLVVVLLVAITILALRDTEIYLCAYLKHLILVLMPIVIVYIGWRFYVAGEFGKLAGAEATFRSLDQWNIAEIPLILKGMGYVAFKKIGFFAPMIIACFLALRGLVKYRTPFDRIVILIATVFLGYTSFLFVTYLGHFGPNSAISVVSFWRYSSHNGMVAVAFISIGGLYYLRHRINLTEFPRWLKTLSMVLVLTLPLGLAHKLRFDLESPKPHFIYVAKDMATFYPKGASLFVLDPLGTGESGKITFFHLNILGSGYLSAFHKIGIENIRERLDKVKVQNFVIVYSMLPGIAEIFGTELVQKKSYLFQKEKVGWKKIREWQKPANYKW